MATRYNYTGGIVTNGLVLNLDAAKVDSYPGTGTTWRDLSGNNNNGTLTNGPTFSGIGKQASIVFDGVDDYVSCNSGILNNSDFTISFWMYYLGGNSQVGLISTWDTSWNGVGIATSNYNNGGVWSLRSWTNNGAGGGMNWGVLNDLKNVWKHITLTYVFSSKTQYGYINSVFQNFETYGSALTHSTLQIARGGQTSSTQLSNYPSSNTRISDVQVYSKSLSQAEITQNFNALRGRYGI
jgi:hypothetical protein